MIALVLSNLALAALLGYVLHSTGKERAKLLNRIQAPERAVHRDLVPASGEPGPAAVLHDDDEDYWNAIEERESPSNLSELVG